MKQNHYVSSSGEFSLKSVQQFHTVQWDLNDLKLKKCNHTETLANMAVFFFVGKKVLKGRLSVKSRGKKKKPAWWKQELKNVLKHSVYPRKKKEFDWNECLHSEILPFSVSMQTSF